MIPYGRREAPEPRKLPKLCSPLPKDKQVVKKLRGRDSGDKATTNVLDLQRLCKTSHIASFLGCPWHRFLESIEIESQEKSRYRRMTLF